MYYIYCECIIYTYVNVNQSFAAGRTPFPPLFGPKGNQGKWSLGSASVVRPGAAH